MKYESPITYNTIQKILPKLKFLQTDSQTNIQTDRPKLYMPPIFQYGALKKDESVTI
jgi:hypothetical protein